METSFGDILKKLRIEKDLTQDNLARMLILGRSTLATWETNKTTPDYDTLKKLASIFDVTTDYLLGLVNDKKSNVTIKFFLDDGREITNIHEMMTELAPEDQQLVLNLILSLKEKNQIKQK